MNKEKVGIFIFFCILAVGIIIGCGHHKRPRIYPTISVVNSSTTPAAPTNVTIVVQQPPAYDQEALLTELLAEIRALGDITVNLTVVVENDLTVESSVEIDGDRIIVYPGYQRRIPNLYHWYHKFIKDNCKPEECYESPKPCDNE
jgi:hypothetical protein